jgi:hypothetical protein
MRNNAITSLGLCGPNGKDHFGGLAVKVIGLASERWRRRPTEARAVRSGIRPHRRAVAATVERAVRNPEPRRSAGRRGQRVSNPERLGFFLQTRQS